MGIEGHPPSAEEIRLMRQKVQEHIDLHGMDVFDNRDLTRWRLDDGYVSKFFMHMYDFPGVQHEHASNMAINTLKWRKENNINDLRESDLSARLKEAGDLYMHGRDRDGKILLVFAVRKHVKGTDSMADLKNFFHYCLERIDRESKGDQLTLVFDCTGCGLKNMDMELIQYMIHVFKEFYPWSLNYILVYEMPWVLNAAWKVIKSWLPAAGVKKIKFLTKSNINEYVQEDQRPLYWGGTDPWEYEWVPEADLAKEPSVGATLNGCDQKSEALQVDCDDDDIDVSQRKTLGSMPELKTLCSLPVPVPGSSPSKSQSCSDFFTSSPASATTPLPNILSLNPADEVVFTKNAAGDIVAKVQLRNVSSKVIVFKIKTTSPEKYRVRPSMSSLMPGAVAVVDISIHNAHLASISGGCGTPAQMNASLSNDKFLITAMTVIPEPEEPLTTLQVGDILKSARPEVQFRLRCRLHQNLLPGSLGASTANATMTDEAKLFARQLDLLNGRLNNLTQANDGLRGGIDTLKKLVSVLLLYVVLTSVLLMKWCGGPDAEPTGSCSHVAPVKQEL